MVLSDQDISDKYRLTLEQVQGFKLIFRQLDTNGDNALDATELTNAMKQLGQPCNPRSVNAVIKASDMDGDGKVEFDEFVAIVASTIKAKARKDSFEQIFEQFDKDGDGYVSVKELQEAWSNVTGESITKQEAQAIVAAADENGDGKISCEEFKIMWKSL